MGVAVLVASHDTQLIDQFGQREIVLDDGTLLSAGIAATAEQFAMTANAPRPTDLPHIEGRR